MNQSSQHGARLLVENTVATCFHHIRSLGESQELFICFQPFDLLLRFRRQEVQNVVEQMSWTRWVILKLTLRWSIVLEKASAAEHNSLCHMSNVFPALY